MGENNGFGAKLLFVVLGLAAAGFAVFFILGGRDVSEKVVTKPGLDAGDVRKMRRQAKSEQLKKILTASRSEVKKPAVPIRVPRSAKMDDGTDQFTAVEKAALKRALDEVYDPVKLARALEDHTGVEYTREMAQAFGELQQATTLETGRGEIPVTEPMKLVIGRMGALRAYAMNLLHAERPSGMEAQQWEQVQNVNERFEARFATMMDEHPYLDLQMVRVPGP